MCGANSDANHDPSSGGTRIARQRVAELIEVDRQRAWVVR